MAGGNGESAGSWMRSEILEQPEVLRRILAEASHPPGALAEAALARGLRLFYIAARGTSDHVAIFTKYLAELLTGLPVALAAPSVITHYGARLRLDEALVLGISQSGRAADANAVLEMARDQGYLTGCITNDEESPMAAAVDFPLFCRAGPERSLPATKTYTASLAVAYTLVTAIAGREDLATELTRTPDLVAEVLGMEAAVADAAVRYRYMEECAVLARGINLCTALELSLKLSETSYVRAHPYSAADFQHGPIAIVERDYPCIIIAPSGRTLTRLRDLVSSLREKGAELIVISDDPEILAQATVPLALPRAPEFLSPITSIVLGQLLALHIARVKGREPDHPRGLKKVTYTL